MRNFIFIILTATLFYGCHTGTFISYEQGDTKLSEKQVALIKPYPGGGILGLINGGDFFPRSVEITFESINGNPINFYKDIEVLPGNCTVSFRFYWSTGVLMKTYYRKVSFYAFAGHTYIVGASRYSNVGWVEDAESGATIAGNPPK